MTLTCEKVSESISSSTKAFFNSSNNSSGVLADSKVRSISEAFLDSEDRTKKESPYKVT